MDSILRRKSYQIKHQIRGSASIGLMLFMVTMIVLVVLPLLMGLLEFQFLNLEKSQVRAATENAVNDIYESVDERAFSKVITIPDLSGFESNLVSHLEDLNCEIDPSEVTVDFVNQDMIIVTFSYVHRFKSFDFQKPMSVFLKYRIPSDQ